MLNQIQYGLFAKNIIDNKKEPRRLFLVLLKLLSIIWKSSTAH